MKTLFQIASVILLSATLLSCSSGKACEKDGTCWQENFRNSSCGMRVQQRCEKICRQCKFSDAGCQACWKCVSHDSFCK